MTTEQIHTVRAALENAGKLLTDAAKAMEPKLDTPPVPPIPAQYAGEFAHEEKPRYDYAVQGDWYLVGHSVLKAVAIWGKDLGKRWILRRLPDRPPMPAPQGECWWCASEKRWITVEEVYGKRLAKLKAPEGHEFTGEFREPVADEVVLANVLHVKYVWSELCIQNTPRLILRPIPPAPKRKTLRLEEVFTGEKADIGYHGTRYRIVEES